jgi:hypothetical protein
VPSSESGDDGAKGKPQDAVRGAAALVGRLEDFGLEGDVAEGFVVWRWMVRVRRGG